MKTPGCVLAFTKERNDALLRAFRQYVNNTNYVRLSEVGKHIVDSPSPRFWVSEDRATAVVSAIMRGKPVLLTMRPTKREMFEEIYRRVLSLKSERPNWCLCQLVSAVINEPAPKFYMEPSSALEYLFKIRNGWYNGKKQETRAGC